MLDDASTDSSFCMKVAAEVPHLAVTRKFLSTKFCLMIPGMQLLSPSGAGWQHLCRLICAYSCTACIRPGTKLAAKLLLPNLH